MATKEKKPVSSSEETSFEILAKRFKAHPFIFTGTILVLILVIVTFVLVPASVPNVANSNRLVFGSYAGKPIEEAQGTYFVQQRNNYVERVRSSKRELNDQTMIEIYYAAFRSTVLHIAIQDQMDKAGYLVPSALIDKEIANYPALQENGELSAAKLRKISKADLLDLKASIKDQLIESRYMQEVSDLHISTQEKEFIKSMATTERSFEFVAWPLSLYPDTEVAAYVTSKPDLFRQIHLSRITAANEGDAKKILASVKDGKSSFEDAAKNQSKDELASKGGDMGKKLAYELATEITKDDQRKAVLALAAGALSDVVQGPNGWAFYRCEEAAKDANVADAELLGKARSYIKKFERGHMEDYLISQANELVTKAESSSFDAACSALKLTKKEFGPVALNYGDFQLFSTISSSKQQELSQASTSENFLKTAFVTTPVAGIAKPLVLGDNIIVLHVKEEKQAEESAISMVELYYSSMAGQSSEQRIQNFYLKSDKLKDNFYEVYFKQIASQTQK